MNDDLWGNIAVDTELKLPVAILKTQASLLEQKTSGILAARVDAFKPTGKEAVGYAFSIVAPELSNYVFKVLTISHPTVLLYPVRVVDQTSKADTSCKTEDEFISVVRQILSSEVVHKAILALLTQSKAAKLR
ncbi:MAG TPA: hypothetical protein PKO33_01690 [Pyrinomonadaceae bacterium]|nr:hypothetical protein [Pyrinomonadaceae bacterium]